MLIRVLAAIVLAAITGSLTGTTANLGGVSFFQLYSLVGQFFLNALTLMVVPLVASSVILGTARMASDRAFGSLGWKTLVSFIATTLLSIVIGLVLTTYLKPGEGFPLPHDLQANASLLSQQGSAFEKGQEFLLRLVPTNILAAASQGQMLGLIVFCLVFGFFTSKIDSHPASIIMGFFEGVFQITMKITRFIMRALPLGVFALVAKVIASTGISSMKSAAFFFAVVVLGLLLQCFVLFPLLLKLVARVNPLRHFNSMASSLITAFSTSSSAAAMPITLDCLEKNAQIPQRLCSFVVPLGTAINMPGTALYVVSSIIFIAQAYQIPFGIGDSLFLIAIVLVTSMGIGGIPSASLIAVMTIVNMMGFPSESVGLILAVERLLDMCRTTSNVFGNSCCAVLVNKLSQGSQELGPIPQMEHG